MTLWQFNKRQGLLTNPARLLLPMVPEKEQYLLEMTSVAATMDLSAELKRAMEVLSEVTSSDCYVYTTLTFETLKSFGRLVAEKS